MGHKKVSPYDGNATEWPLSHHQADHIHIRCLFIQFLLISQWLHLKSRLHSITYLILIYTYLKLLVIFIFFFIIITCGLFE